MTTNNIDATKVLKNYLLGGASAQVKASKVVKYYIINPAGTGPAHVSRRAHVRVTRKTVAT